ncbi:hypothetical protein Pla52n_60790 [Stieleria varia]|uniref:Uncharacterized protein n=1 Tax=Stieleria varia TaxID=2528005 RepID=A0A5C5ZYK1_9BACT|nr:hypothetical protein Pla52n_60790 [Stieleria varia]
MTKYCFELPRDLFHGCVFGDPQPTRILKTQHRETVNDGSGRSSEANNRTSTRRVSKLKRRYAWMQNRGLAQGVAERLYAVIAFR